MSLALCNGKVTLPHGEWPRFAVRAGANGDADGSGTPIGAVIIGAYADRAGRKAALTLTIMLMAVGTAVVAFTPGYNTIGIAAPILLIAGRLIQGFSCGGEVGPRPAICSKPRSRISARR